MTKKILPFLSIAALLSACSKESKLITPQELSYEVTTFAGKETFGKVDGKKETATFNNPTSLAFDSKDNLYIADASNYALRVINTSGVVSTINDKATPFESAPIKINISADDEVIIKSVYPSNNILCKTYSEKNGLKNFIVDAKTINVMNTGSVFKNSKGEYFYFENSSINKMSPSLIVEKDWLKNIEISATQLDGNIISVDKNDNFIMLPSDFESLFKGQIKIVSANKTISFLKANNTFDKPTVYNYGDGTLPKAHIGFVSGLCVDKTGIIYFIDHDLGLGHRVRKIDLDKKVTTLAGGITEGFKDGLGKEALFTYISGIAVNSKGEVFVAVDNRIRKISVVK